jgi:hypothetical protein
MADMKNLTKVPEWLLKEANNCPWIKGRVMRWLVKPIYHNDCVVGLYHPRQEKSGFMISPIYVTPESRRLGLMYQTIKEIKVRPIVVCVNEKNRVSERLFEKLGFIRWRRFNGKVKGWYWILR